MLSCASSSPAVSPPCREDQRRTNPAMMSTLRVGGERTGKRWRCREGVRGGGGVANPCRSAPPHTHTSPCFSATTRSPLLR